MTTPEAYPPTATFLETDLQPWHDRMEELMAQGASIIAFRGAGAVNGIEPPAAEIMSNILGDYIERLTANGRPTAIVYDGDADIRERPDVGAIFGTIADRFADNPLVTPIAVQSAGWYSPTAPNAALCSATGTPYETYVFRETLPEVQDLPATGLAHSALSQSDALVRYLQYEQVVLGPVGPIAFAQLGLLARQTAQRPADAGPVRVSIWSSHVNPALREGIEAALSDPDPAKRARAAEKLDQRTRYPYGALCLSNGLLAIDEADYPGIAFSHRHVYREINAPN